MSVNCASKLACVQAGNVVPYRYCTKTVLCTFCKLYSECRAFTYL